jgi:hypothetical protein
MRRGCSIASPRRWPARLAMLTATLLAACAGPRAAGPPPEGAVAEGEPVGEGAGGGSSSGDEAARRGQATSTVGEAVAGGSAAVGRTAGSAGGSAAVGRSRARAAGAEVEKAESVVDGAAVAGSGVRVGEGSGGQRGRFPERVASVAFEVRIHPPGETEVAGFVRDRDGNPVGRACVELSAAGGVARPPVFTSGQGNFRFAGVTPGLVRVTMTVEDMAAVDGKRISDYHTQDPRLTVMLRPLVLAPAHGRLEVLRIKREGDLGQGDGTRWIEVAPLALALEGYSSACRRALRPVDR